MESIYQNIQNMCIASTLYGKQIFITIPNGWLVGSYNNLKEVAVQLRVKPELFFKMVEDYRTCVRFGSRNTDEFSSRSILKGGFRKKNQGKQSGLSETQAKTLLSMRKRNRNKNVRITDEYAIVQEWFHRRTLEAHHIIEDSIIKKLDIENKELNRGDAPCVLVVAELHRRRFTPEGQKVRDKVTKSTSKKDLMEAYRLYDDGFRMEDLIAISDTIIEGAFGS